MNDGFAQIMDKVAKHWQRIKPRARLRRGPLPVMFVITSMPVGGAEVLLANLVRGLDKKRFRPEIVCLKEAGPLGVSLKGEVKIHADMLAGKYDLRVLPRLIKLFRSKDVAAVITVGAGDKMFWGRLAAWLAGVPTIFSALHSTGWPDGVGRMNRWLTKITDGFIAVADHHSKHLVEVEKFPESKVFTIRNGVDTERFVPDLTARAAIRQSLGIALDSPVFGIVAALRPEKNHAMFVRTALRIAHRFPDARFLIVGDGPERPAIEMMISAARLEKHVVMMGSRDDTPAILAAMDAFLLCSNNEASPVSILEALSCEVPVIATRVGSVSESVIVGQTGFLVDIDDDEQMAKCAGQWIEAPEMLSALGRKGRELVQASGSLDSMVQGYSNLIETTYDNLAKRRNPAIDLRDRRKVPRNTTPADSATTEACATVTQNTH